LYDSKSKNFYIMIKIWIIKYFFFLCIIASLFYFSPSFTINSSETEGDEKIRETIERIKEEEEQIEEQEVEKEEEDEVDEIRFDEDSSLESFIGKLIGQIFKILFRYSFTVRYADYPYFAGNYYIYNTSSLFYPEERNIFSVQLSTDFAYHFDETYSLINKINAQISAVHINIFNQFIFSESEWFSIISGNAGLSFFLPNFMLNGYLGFFKLNFLERYLFSYGFSSKLFLPKNFYIDFYNINSTLGSLRFIHFAFNLNYSIRRFNIGIGYNYNDYAKDLYKGPCLKGSIWF